MIPRLTISLLRAYKALPRASSIRADSIPIPLGRPERLRLVRRMEDLKFVDAISRRPKIVVVARRPFARSLHAALNDKPHLINALKDHGLLVVGILATSPEPLSIREIARLANLHANTVGPIIRRLAYRAFLSRVEGKFKLANHALDAIQLGQLYMEHLQQSILETHPTTFPIVRHYGRLVVETKEPIGDLELTGASYFQNIRAGVLSKSHVYALVPTGASITERDAYLDFVSAAPPKRTLKEVEKHLSDRIVANVPRTLRGAPPIRTG